MLVMDHKVFRRFWYPVIPLAHLASGPKRFELLGQALALFIGGEGQPAALEDRCSHRSARLSMGQVCDGVLACPYHGWQYDRDGHCVSVPQLPDASLASHRARAVRSFRCEPRYGYVWVALEEPLYGIPRIPEAEEGSFRLVHAFHEIWRVGALRVMENELDLAHPSFVHRNTFGSQEHRVPREIEVERFDGGLNFRGRLGVATAHHSTDHGNDRTIDATWFAPFVCRIRINYPDGPPHVIVNMHAPIDNDHSMMSQFCLLAEHGRGMDVDKIIAFDRAVTLEDKLVLEGTDADVPLELTAERHMPSDRPGIVMRQVLKELLERHEPVPALATS